MYPDDLSIAKNAEKGNHPRLYGLSTGGLHGEGVQKTARTFVRVVGVKILASPLACGHPPLINAGGKNMALSAN